MFQYRTNKYKQNFISDVLGKERHLWQTSSKVRVSFVLNGTTFNTTNSNQKQNISPEEWEPLQNSYLVIAKANIWKVNVWFKIVFRKRNVTNSAVKFFIKMCIIDLNIRKWQCKPMAVTTMLEDSWNFPKQCRQIVRLQCLLEIWWVSAKDIIWNLN